MSWQDRLREYVKFVSPSGQEFTPFWKGDDIQSEKRLGRHAYPNMDKEVVQDLGMNSRSIPLTVYFAGPDHDKAARGFEKTLFEREAWQVTHPVYGLMSLQLVSYKFSVNPVESGNITIFQTEWVEPVSEDEISALSDPAAEVETAAQAVNASTIKDTAAVTQEAVSESKAAANALKSGITAIKGAIKSTNARISAIQNRINELITGAYLDIASITGELIELIEAPDLMLNSLLSKAALFTSLGKKMNSGFSSSPTTASNGGTSAGNKIKNTALVQQLFLNTIQAAMGLSIISEPPETRREALAILSEYQSFARENQAALDEAAKATEDYRIEQQFVARVNSGEAIATLNAAVIRYLVNSLFDLKIERRITVERPKTPLEIAIMEYKASADNADSYYELFCRTNDLHGKELLLLPAGRELVIYG